MSTVTRFILDHVKLRQFEILNVNAPPMEDYILHLVGHLKKSTG